VAKIDAARAAYIGWLQHGSQLRRLLLAAERCHGQVLRSPLKHLGDWLPLCRAGFQVEAEYYTE
jgi:hypothetical protein